MLRKRKTREAVCFLLKRLGGTSTYGAVTKLLYIADRESLRKQGRSITGYTMCALPQGPILSVVLDRLNGSHPEFKDLIANGPGYEVRLIGTEEPSELTYSDLSILDEVFQQYGALSWEDPKSATHQFGEWKRYDKGQDTWSLISPTDVAEALHFSPEEKQILLENVEERDSIFAFLNGLGEPSTVKLKHSDLARLQQGFGTANGIPLEQRDLPIKVHKYAKQRGII